MGGFLLPKFRTVISDVKDITDILHNAKYQVINIKHIIIKNYKYLKIMQEFGELWYKYLNII